MSINQCELVHTCIRTRYTRERERGSEGERERGRERGGERERGRERERERGREYPSGLT